MLALYLFSLALSGLLTGLFVRDAFSSLGYLPGFSGGLALAAAGACAYIAVQTAYFALLRLLKPTKDRPVLFTELLSHLCAAVFIPYLLHVKVAWPHPRLADVEPLIYLAAFLIAHGAFKFVSFYAALRGRPAGRLGALGWIGATACFAVGSYAAFSIWLSTMEQVREQHLPAATYQAAGDTYAPAAPLSEGGRAGWAVSPGEEDSILFDFAPTPEGDAGYVYVTFGFEGPRSDRITRQIRLHKDRWTLERLAPEDVPKGTQRVHVTWRKKRDSLLEKVFGLPPVIRWDQHILVSNPVVCGVPGPEQGPNVVIVLLEGLSADSLAATERNRPKTPALDGAMNESLVFTEAFSPAPDAAGATMSVLCGRDPLAHGYLGRRRGSPETTGPTLAEQLHKKGYVSAAFVEGDADAGGSLALGTGFERGFDRYDPAAPPNQDSAYTLGEARAWLADHLNDRFFLVVRLRELADPALQDRYGLSTEEDTAPSPREVYNAAVQYVDAQLGRLLADLKGSDAGKRLCLVITAPYGLDFSQGKLPVVGLTEGSLHVPLLLGLPSRMRGDRDQLAELQDIYGTITRMCGLEPAAFDLLAPTGHEAVIAATGSPFALSLRNTIWRFGYQPGVVPFTWEASGQPRTLSLVHIGDTETGPGQKDVSGSYPAVVERLEDTLNAYLTTLAGKNIR